MAGTKEIRTKIASVSSTQKITKAMEMVAASKMRKAQERMTRGKPYAERIRSVVGHLANAAPEYKHLYLQEREIRRVGYIIVSSDRGLCGGLNTNLFKAVIRSMKEWDARNVEIDLCVIGTKGAGFFSSLGGRIIAVLKQLGDEPSSADLIGGVKIMLDAYGEQKIDRLYIASNKFVNTMTQQPSIAQALPLEASDDKSLKHHWDYLYEPDAKQLLDGLLTRYIESQVYQGLIENLACEQAARMVAMKNATENAGELIADLKLVYNKARQSAITQELAEIVGGAAAIS
ncbi:MAG: F0F1 ATP synthase subunit gamma [Pseudomonadales bacterium]|nr:F0F1 ATP synthase subunit gamma [Pseudomonadales bacterium]